LPILIVFLSNYFGVFIAILFFFVIVVFCC